MRRFNLSGLPGRIITALLAVACLIGAYFLMQTGLNELSQARQLERLPVTPIAALSKGPYLISGTIDAREGTITAPYSGAEAVYAEYRLTEEYRDSDGDLRTRVLESGQRSVDFQLADHTGSTVIDSPDVTDTVDWNVSRSYSRESGRKTYEEWTLVAGNTVRVVGQFNATSNQMAFTGLDAASLPALVSDKSLGSDSGDRLFKAAIYISMATGLLALGVALFLPLFKVHRFWVYLTIMSVTLVGTLSVVGVTQLQKEWKSIERLYEGRYQQVESASGDQLRLADVAALKRLIDRNTSGWLDRWMAKATLEKNLPLPALDAATEARVEDIVAKRPKGRFTHSGLSLGLSAGSVLLALIVLYFAIKTVKFKRLVEAVPTSSTQGASFGLCELKGMIELTEKESFLTDPLLNEKCVAFDYKVQEKRGSGKNSRWETIEQITERLPFLLEDPHGNIRVEPDGANIEYPKYHTETRGNRRYSVKVLDAFTNVYCLGLAGLDSEKPDHLTIQKDDNGGASSEFLISYRSEDEILINRASFGFAGVALSLGLALFGTTAFLAADGLFSPSNLLASAMSVPVLLLVYIAILHYNDIVFLHNRVERARANIDTILQQRHDLWPNLEKIVKASMAHERDLQTAIAKLRSVNPSAITNPKQADELMAFEQEFTRRLQARIEDYPDMKNHTVISKFMTIMADTENYLSLLRNSHTESAEIYNTRIQSFPDVILAKLFGFKPCDYFLTEKSIF